MTTCLRTKYFPHELFLDASLGRIPSYYGEVSLNDVISFPWAYAIVLAVASLPVPILVSGYPPLVDLLPLPFLSLVDKKEMWQNISTLIGVLERK